MGQLGDRILIVEDDVEFSNSLRHCLEGHGYQVECVADGQEALLRLARSWPNAILLDLHLPRLGGMAVLEWIRRVSHIPVLVLSGSPEASAFTNAFALGADDFLRKPFSAQELLVRLRVRLDRAQLRSQPRTQLGNLLIDWARAEVFRGAEAVALTALEFQLLSALYQHRDQVLTREWLLEHVWKHAKAADARLIDATVKRLRRKVGAHLIDTVRGMGFRLAFG